MNETYRFRIDGPYRPDNLPMSRLAEYLEALSALLGETAQVHFRTVEEGSAVLCAQVDEAAQPKVAARVEAVRDMRGTDDAKRAYEKLDDLLREDNAQGELFRQTALVIPFPGRTRTPPRVYGPFKKEGHLDGQVIRVGGKPPTVPIHLQDGDQLRTGLYTTPAIAKRIAHFIYGPVLRVHGTGAWFRSSDSKWELRNFRVLDFEELDQRGVYDIATEARLLATRGWQTVDDLYRSVSAMRANEETPT